MEYIRLMLSHRKTVSFGFTLNFFSNFGQTFLISLFVPFILADFALTKTEFGFFYSAATVASAFFLSWFGRFIDSKDLKTYSLFIAGGLALSALMMASSQHLLLLFPAIMGLRLFGKGLLSHTAQTTMARSFNRLRGKALSVTALGYPLGEGLLPGLVAALIALFGWKWTWGLITMTVVLLLIPIILWLAESSDSMNAESRAKTSVGLREQQRILANPKFYKLIPASIMAPFILAGLLLYQLPIALEKGWSPEWIATSFIGFAIARSLFSIVSGSLIDRFTARKVFPFYMVPLALGIILLGSSDALWVAPVYLILAGTSVGFAVNVKSALWAEVFGPERLGTVRSTAATLAVLSTAVSPIITGFVLESNLSTTGMLYSASVLIAIVAVLAFRSIKKMDVSSGEQNIPV